MDNVLEEDIGVVAEAGKVAAAVERFAHAEGLERVVERQTGLSGEPGELEADLDIEHRFDDFGPLFGVLEGFLHGLLDRDTGPRENDVRHELLAVLLEAVGQLDDLGAVELGVVEVLFHGHHVTLDGVAWAVFIVAAVEVTGPGEFLVEALGPLHLQGDDVDEHERSRGVDQKEILDHVLGVLCCPRVDGLAARERVHVCIESLGADLREVWVDFLDPERIADGDGDLLVLLLEELLAHPLCLVQETILVVCVDAEQRANLRVVLGVLGCAETDHAEAEVDGDGRDCRVFVVERRGRELVGERIPGEHGHGGRCLVRFGSVLMCCEIARLLDIVKMQLLGISEKEPPWDVTRAVPWLVLDLCWGK